MLWVLQKMNLQQEAVALPRYFLHLQDLPCYLETEVNHVSHLLGNQLLLCQYYALVLSKLVETSFYYLWIIVFSFVHLIA